tara:strand:- start:818 stop:1408 length:591 start_codon:yes stop_codon:yes gene_type:complete
LIDFEEIDIELGIDKPKILKLDKYNPLNIHNYDDVINYVNSLSYDKEGVMLFSKCRKYRTKIKSPMHIYVNKLLGNCPDILYKLLELRHNNELLKINEILKYYCEYSALDNTIKDALDKLSTIIYNLYVEKRINHNLTLEVPKIYGKVLYDIHQIYFERQNRRRDKASIKLEDINEYLNTKTDTTYLYLMIKNIIG